MRNQANSAAAITQRFDRAHHHVQGFGVQRAKTLINEQGIQLDTAVIRLHNLSQTQRQRQRRQERLTTGQRRRLTRLARPGVGNLQVQAAAGTATLRTVIAEHHAVAALTHAIQVQ